MPSFIQGEMGAWTGAAVASVPIDVPPGPADHAPRLTLAYSSNVVEDVYFQGGKNDPSEVALQIPSSPYGYGWDLSGVPSITRVGRSGYFGDTQRGGFEMSLGGDTVRLIRRTPDSTGPTPTPASPPMIKQRLLYQTYPQSFMYVARTTIETADARVCGYEPYYQESRWEVITKDGTHYEFGGRENTKLTAEHDCTPINQDDYNAVQFMISGGADLDTNVLPARWFVTKITDVHGNVIRFRYRKESFSDPYNQGEQYPREGQYDAAITLAEITWGGSDVSQHRAKVVVVPQPYPRRDNVLSINKTVDKKATPNPSPTTTIIPQDTATPKPTSTPDWLHWRFGTQLEAEKPPGYMSGYLIDRIEVKVKQNVYPEAGGTPTPAWATLRTYNLEYTYHTRNTGGFSYDRAFLDKVTLSDGDIPQTPPAPSATPTGTLTPATALPSTSTPAPTARQSLPAYDLDYHYSSSAINWLPLKSVDNGLGGKVEYTFSTSTTPTPVVCWNPYERKLREHRRRPVDLRKVYDNATPVSSHTYAYEGGRCSEKFSEDVEGANGYWYEFLGYGTVKETITDHTLSPTAVALHKITSYYRCRGETTQSTECLEQTPTPTPTAATPTPGPKPTNYFGLEPHPNKGSIRRQTIARNQSTATPDADTINEYVVEDLSATYIGYATTEQVVSPWGRLDRVTVRHNGRSALAPANPTMQAVSSVTEYKYDASQQGGKQWGNVTHIREYVTEANYPNSPYRTERTWYNTKEQINKDDFSVTASTFIVDRPRSRALLENSGALPINTPPPSATDVAHEIEWFTYDGQNKPTDGVLTRGVMTRHSRVEPIASFPGGLSSGFISSCTGTVERFRTIDRTFTFDHPTPTPSPVAGGNKLSESMFTGYGYVCVVNPHTPSENVYVDDRSSSPKGEQKTTYSYETVLGALPATVTNAKGHTTSYQYFGVNSTAAPTAEGYFASQLHGVIDANTNQTTFAYDLLGRIVKEVRSGDSLSSPSVAYGYSDASLSPSFPTLHSVWTKREPGASVWSDGGVWERTSLNGRGLVVENQRPHFNWAGNPAAPAPTPTVVASGNDVVVHRSYDALGNLVTITNPYLKSAYAAAGTNPYVTPVASQYKTTTTYDPIDRPLVVTSPNGKKVEHNYYVIATAPALWVDDVIDEKRHRRQSRTDGFGRMVEIREYEGNCSGVSGWFPCQTPYATPWQADSQAITTAYRYGHEDEIVEVTGPDGGLTGISYDRFDRKTELTDPDLGTWSYVYDAADNLTLQVDARGQGVCRFYDEMNRETQRRYVAGATPSPCTVNNLTGTPTPVGTPGPSMAYDAGTNGKGYRTSMSLPDSSSYSWTYDAVGRMSRETQYLSGQGSSTYNTDYTYKSDGQIASLAHPDTLDTLNFTYNAGGVSTIKSSASSSGHPNQEFVSRTDYTADGRVDWRVLGPSSNKVVQDSDYNADDLRLYRIRAGTEFTAPHYKEFMDHYYTYDDAGNCTEIADWVAGIPQRMSLVYDDRDRLTSSTASNGTLGYGNYGPDSYTYDKTGNIVTKDGLTYSYHASKTHAVRKIFDNGSGTNSTVSIRARKTSACAADLYVDAVVNNSYRGSATISGSGFGTFTFTTALPLTGNDVISLGFDGGGDNYLESDPACDVQVDSITIAGAVIDLENGRTAFDKGAYFVVNGWDIESSAAVDGDEMSAPTEAVDGGTTYVVVPSEGSLRFARGTQAAAYEYDANGNMNWRIIDGAAFELVWDAENRLAEIKKVDSAGATEAKFTYDADGRRIKAQRGSYYSLHVGDLYEYTEYCPGAGGTNCGKSDVASYYYANGDPVAMYQGAQWTGRSLYWRLSDHLASTSKTITASTLGVRAESRYKAWGEYRYKAGTQATIRQFTGQEKEPADGAEIEGLYFYNARYYEPNAGRFISADTLVPDPGASISLNRYGYANNSPLRYNDPEGRYAESAIDIAFIVADIRAIQTGGLTWTNGLSLAADIGGLALPGLTGGGLAVRAGAKGIRALQAADVVAQEGAAVHDALQDGQISGGAAARLAVGVVGARGRGGDATLGVAQGKGAGGQFLPRRSGESVPGSATEREVWDAIGEKPGWRIERARVYARNADGTTRVYDGVAISPKGRVIGLEIKSGSKGRTPRQEAFDAGVGRSSPASAYGRFSYLPPIRRTVLIRRPSEYQ